MDIEAQTGIYTIKTPSFEGPFNLLLSLIEERKLFVNEISLATVTEDYIRHINENPHLPPAYIAGFMSVAATLILIKSKSLLPNLPLTSEEESDIKNLEERLRLYEMYMKLANDVRAQFGKRIIFQAEERKRDVLVFLPDSQITRESMMTFASEILNRMPQKTFLPKVEVKKVISIEEMITRLTDRIQSAMKLSFKDFAGGSQTKEEKVTVIVGFLAMLELARQGILSLVQENNFEDIIIEKQELEMPATENI